MSDMNSLCLTCLSDAVNGVSIPTAITEFLQNVLQFKFILNEGLPHLICLLCYRTLFEMKRFYGQLQDVEHYFRETVPVAAGFTKRSKQINIRNVTDIISKAKSNKIDARDNEVQFERDADGFYHCDQCYRIYEETRDYKKHQLWHKQHGITRPISTKEKKYACDTCEKHFRTPGERSAHKIVHTNLRPYICNHCPKTFRQQSSLSVHKQVHFGKRVVCPDCGKRCSTTHELIGHSKVHNRKGNITSYKCDVCVQTFVSPRQLKMHKGKHNQRLQCERCDKVYCSEEAFKTHQQCAHHMENDMAILVNTDRAECLDSPTNDLILKDEDILIVEDETETILG